MLTQLLPTGLINRGVALADAFAAPHGIDRYLEQVAPRWSSIEVRGRVAAVDRSSESGIVLSIEANRNWTGFRAGQHTELTVEIDGVRHTRCYSMASAAGSTHRFELGIKAHPQGLVSRHLVDHAEVGLTVGLSPAAGDFCLPDDRPDRLLLISGGSGITPVLSMLRTLCAEGHTAPVTFLHYATSPEAQLFRAELSTLTARHGNVRVLTAYDDGSGQLTGVLSAEHLDAADADWREAEAYVCGPAPLMEAVRRHYESIGSPGRFHQEAFTLASFVRESGNVEGAVRFGRSDLVVAGDGRPVLELAESAGLDPVSGCRMGICHTCVRPLTGGTVRNAVTGEITAGTNVDIRVCVSIPVGDVDIDL